MFRRQFWLWCLQRRRTGSPKSQVSRFLESHFRLLCRTRETSHLELQFISFRHLQACTRSPTIICLEQELGQLIGKGYQLFTRRSVTWDWMKTSLTVRERPGQPRLAKSLSSTC